MWEAHFLEIILRLVAAKADEKIIDEYQSKNDVHINEMEHKLKNKPSIGLEGGGPTMWWGSIPPDQKPMDKDSLFYDSDTFDESFIEVAKMIASHPLIGIQTEMECINQCSEMSLKESRAYLMSWWFHRH